MYEITDAEEDVQLLAGAQKINFNSFSASLTNAKYYILKQNKPP